MRHIFLQSVVILFFPFLLSNCSTVPVTGRHQLNLVSSSEMNSMALTNYQSFLSSNTVIPTGTNAEMVKRVGVRISKAVELYLKNSGNSDLISNYKWEFNLIKNDATPNAWCMPGGKVVVYSGILPLTQTEDALAVVLGHEIAHAVANHGGERMSQQLLVQLGGVGLDLYLSQNPTQASALFGQAYGTGTGVGLLAFSRKQESEADHLGLIFMAMAGYNPDAAIPFWQRMSNLSQGQTTPAFLSTHPSDGKRINDIEGMMPEVKKYKKAPTYSY